MADTDSIYDVTVTVRINKRLKTGGYTGEQLTINEDFHLDVTSFIDIANVLGKFEELATHLKEETKRE
jgi:hypothetical protein